MAPRPIFGQTQIDQEKVQIPGEDGADCQLQYAGGISPLQGTLTGRRELYNQSSSLRIHRR